MPGDTINVDLPSVVSAYLALDKAWGSAGDADWRWTTTVGLIYDHYTSSSQTFQSGAPFVVPPGFPVSSTGVIASEDFFKPFIGVKATNGEWSVLGEYKPRLRWGNLLQNGSAMGIFPTELIPSAPFRLRIISWVGILCVGICESLPWRATNSQSPNPV